MKILVGFLLVLSMFWNRCNISGILMKEKLINVVTISYYWMKEIYLYDIFKSLSRFDFVYCSNELININEDFLIDGKKTLMYTC